MRFASCWGVALASIVPSISFAGDSAVLYEGGSRELATTLAKRLPESDTEREFRRFDDGLFPGVGGVMVAIRGDDIRYCIDRPTTSEELNDKLNTANAKLDELELEEAERLLVGAERALPCLSDFVGGELVGRLFFLRGILSSYREDEKMYAQAFFRQSLVSNPAIVWDESYPPNGKLLFLEEKLASAERALHPTRSPAPVLNRSDAEVKLDGKVATDAMLGLHIAQWKDGDGKVHGACFVAKDDEIVFTSKPRWLATVLGGPVGEEDEAILGATFNQMDAKEITVMNIAENPPIAYTWFVKATAAPFVFHDFAEKKPVVAMTKVRGGIGVGGGVVLLSRTLYGGPTIEAAIPVGQKAELHLGGNLTFSSYGGYAFVLPGIDLSFLGVLSERGRVRFLLGGGASAEFTKQTDGRPAVIISGLFKVAPEVKMSDHAFLTVEVLVGGGNAGLHLGARVLLRFR